MESDIDLAPGKLSIPAITGILGGAPVSGALTVENGTRISGELATGPVDLPHLLGLAFLPWTGRAPDLEGPFSTGVPGGLTGELWIKPDTLEVFEGLSIGEAQIGISVDQGQIRLAAAGKSATGEDVQLEFGSRPDGQARAIDGRIAVPVDLAVVLRTSEGKPIAAGPMKLSARFEASGRSPAAAFAALQGSGSYSYTGASLRRIDAPHFADLIAKAKSAEDVGAALSALLSGGEMALEDNKGAIAINDGIAGFHPISVSSPSADVTLTPAADLANGSLDLAAKVQLKAIEKLPAMNVSYIGRPGMMTEIVDANALESYLGFKIMERSLDELERLQREQQRIYEEQQRARREDEARLEAYYAQRRELQLRARELKAHRTNQEIQAERRRAETERLAKESAAINKRELSVRAREGRVHRAARASELARAKAEAERSLKETKALNKTEMNVRVRELRVHRRLRATAGQPPRVNPADRPPEKGKQTSEGARAPGEPLPGSPSGEAVRIPLPKAKAAQSDTTAASEPLEPLVLIPAEPEPSESGLLDDLFTAPASMKKWLKRREENR
jgi:hypothetical protein